jgi:putative spermidine/putrescine transport system permease protein
MNPPGTRRGSRIALGVLGAVIVFWLVAPALVVIPLSFTDKESFAFPPSGFSLEWFENFFEDDAWHGAAWQSLKIALLTAVVSTVLGSAAALGLTRARPAIRGALGAFFLAPMIIPLVVLAIGIYALFLDLRLVGTVHGFVLAHTVLAFPFVVTNVYAGLLQFDPELERAAHSLGANRFVTFFKVTLPIIRPSVLAGFLFAFVVSFDEVVVGLFLSDPFTTTLPVQMYLSVSEDVDPTVAATASLMLLLTTALVVIGLLAAGRAFRGLLNIGAGER